MIESLVMPFALMGGLGLVFGAGLAVASKVFAVKKDERIDGVRECLPGANCGGCGYPGCDGYAKAIVENGISITLCTPGGKSTVDAIAKVMGLEDDGGDGKNMEKKVANIICRGSCDNVTLRFDYSGEKSCRVVALTSEGDKSCRYACVGYGDCVNVCKFGALSVSDNRIVTVDEEKCTGCGACQKACPKNVIRIEPDYKVRVRCRAMEKGKLVLDHCKAGCIGCGKCEKSCKFDAVIVKDNLPMIDREKCVGCLECARYCPTGAMMADLTKQEKAYINAETCIGCTICKKQCKFDAISGELREKHIVDVEYCTGCGLCAPKCPKKAIEMRIPPKVTQYTGKPIFHDIMKLSAKPELYSNGTGSIWQDAHISKKMLEAHLDPNLEAATRKHEFLDKSAAWIAQIAPPIKYNKLLDLGCGPGLYCERYKKAGFDVTGIDFSARSIAYAKKQAKAVGHEIEYICADYSGIDYAEQFDIITLIYCDYSVLSEKERAALAKRIHRALKPGGKFIVDVFTPKKRKSESQNWHRADNGGFYSPVPHVCLESVYQYADSDETELRRIVVIEKTAVKCFNIWDHFFDAKKITGEFMAAGFTGVGLFGDAAGAPYEKDGDTICCVATK